MPSSPARRLACILAAMSLLVACGSEPADVLEGRPGLRLLDHVNHMRAEPTESRQLSDDVVAALSTWHEGDTFEIAPQSWRAVEPLSGSESALLLTGVRIDTPRRATRWEVNPPVDLDLPLGQAWIEIGDTRLRPHSAVIPGTKRTTTYWRNTSRPIVMWWDVEARVLVAISEERPPATRLGYQAGRGARLDWWDERLGRSNGTEGDRPLRHRLTLGGETQDCIAAPTPGVLSFDIENLSARELDVRYGAVSLGVDMDGGRLRAENAKLPELIFAIEAETHGEVVRLWERRAHETGRLGHVRVDLSPYTGSGVRLRLVTEAAPGTPATECFALWSSLVLRDARADAPDRPHIVLLDIDTLRADRLGCYGNPRDTSPNIDAWAEREAAIYTHHVSANNWTLPSTVSMLTGLPVSAHGVLRFPLSMDIRHEPLALRLRAAGYETLGQSDGGFVVPDHGFDVGFDRFVVRKPSAQELASDGWSRELGWLRERDSENPVFLFLQTYMVHAPFANDSHFDDADAPYTGPLSREPVLKPQVDAAIAERGGTLLPEDVQYLLDIYDAGVRRMDDVVGRFLDALPDVFGDEPYIVVLTSDHGEELGERGTIGHGTTLYGEQLRVPLILRVPGVTASRVDSPVSSLDLVPTLLSLAGVSRDERLAGRVLTEERLREEALLVSQHDEAAFSAEQGGWKLIHDESVEQRRLGVGIYDLVADPVEQEPAPAVGAARARALLRGLKWFREKHAMQHEPRAGGEGSDAEQLKQLKALGYLDGN